MICNPVSSAMMRVAYYGYALNHMGFEISPSTNQLQVGLTAVLYYEEYRPQNLSFFR